MHRKRTGVRSVLSAGKEAVLDKFGPNAVSRFKGKLGGAIAVITSMIVGFLVIPNNVLYFIDDTHKTRLRVQTLTTQEPDTDDVGSAYIHAGIAVMLLGFCSMVFSCVLSFFAGKSKYKTDATDPTGTRTVVACLVMMNAELFMAVLVACMELFYRPLTKRPDNQHTIECAIAVLNIIIYVLYVITMALTSTLLREKSPVDPVSYVLPSEVPPDVMMMGGHRGSVRDYHPMVHGVNSYNTPSEFMM